MICHRPHLVTVASPHTTFRSLSHPPNHAGLAGSAALAAASVSPSDAERWKGCRPVFFFQLLKQLFPEVIITSEEGPAPHISVALQTICILLPPLCSWNSVIYSIQRLHRSPRGLFSTSLSKGIQGRCHQNTLWQEVPLISDMLCEETLPLVCSSVVVVPQFRSCLCMRWKRTSLYSSSACHVLLSGALFLDWWFWTRAVQPLSFPGPHWKKTSWFGLRINTNDS